MNDPTQERLPADLFQPWLSELVGAIGVPAALVDGVQILIANDALCRLVGRRDAAQGGLPATDLLAAGDRQAFDWARSRCLEYGEQPPALPLRLLNGDGSERNVELHLRRIRATQGAALLLLTCVDQTDILHVQSSLFGLTEMLGQIVDGAPVATLVIDSQRRVTHWNRACERLTGVPRSEVLGSTQAWRPFYRSQRKMLLDLVVEGADEEAVRALYGHQVRASPIIPGGMEAEVHFAHFGADGEGAWLLLTAAPLRNAQGAIVGAIETLQDVTERRRNQEELLRHRNELEQLVQQRTAELSTKARELEMFVTNAPIGVAYSRGNFLEKANRAMAEMFATSQAGMVGSPVRGFHVSSQHYDELRRLVAEVLGQGESLHHEMWMRRVDGRPIWMQIDAHIAEGHDVRGGIWWMMQDRTEIRAAQEQLQARVEELRALNHRLGEAQNQLLQQDKLASIGQLAAGVAHEINNPVGFVNSNLNSLRQYVEGLLTLCGCYDAALAAPGDAQRRAELQRCRDEVELDYLREDLPQLLDECADGLGRVKKIVQDLKDFSRVDQADWQEADLNAGLESTLNVVRHEVKYKADVVKQLAPLPPVMCLAAQLNQVFMNLIVNAVHAIRDRGTITLSSGESADWVWVQVDDSGCGMTEEVQRRVFEPFYTTKEVGKGTGLGLSLSFSIVQKHGGLIQVRSAPGQGSSFRVWVPVAGPQSLAPHAEPPPWPHATDAGAGAAVREVSHAA